MATPAKGSDIGQYSVVLVDVLCEIEFRSVFNLPYRHNINDEQYNYVSDSQRKSL